jgi:hypothetical protein
MKADYLDAKMQSHRGNLQRSARLLATQLTELERDYLHKRIEEGAEVARLELEQAAKAAQVKKPLPSPVRGRCAACRLFESRTEHAVGPVPGVASAEIFKEHAGAGLL